MASDKMISEKGTVPFCSADSAKSGQSPIVLLDALNYFRHFVHRLFLHRRKVLRTVLAGEFKGKLDKPAVDRLMAGLQLSATTRAEELDVEAMLRLAATVKKATHS